MKIAIIDDATSKPFTIADGSTSRVVGSIVGPSDLDISATRKVQTDEPIRGKSAVLTARANRKTTLSFKTTIQQKSVSDCQQFCLDYDSTVPLSGVIVFTTELEGGPATRYMTNATVDAVRSRPEGTSSYHTFTVSGNMVSKNNS